MNFFQFRSQIKHLPVFNLNDIRKIDPDFHERQLMDWIKRGYIRSVAGEFYLLSDTRITEDLHFMIANYIYGPSYISLESALAHHYVIPETVLGVTSVSSRKTKRYDSDWGFFTYRTLKPVLMFGYQITKGHDQIKYSMAMLEKAVLDYLYLNSHIGSIQDFESLRWNKRSLAGLVGNERLIRYQKIFNQKTLDKRVSIMMEFLHA